MLMDWWTIDAKPQSECRKLLLEEKPLREARRHLERVVLYNVRFLKFHSKAPDTTILTYVTAGESISHVVVEKLEQPAPLGIQNVPPPQVSCSRSLVLSDVFLNRPAKSVLH